METSEFVQLGQKLIEHGTKLDQLKKERDALDVQITALEKEIKPLFIKYNAILSEVIGKTVPAPAASTPTPPPPSTAPSGPPALRGGNLGVGKLGSLATRITTYLRRAEASGQLGGRSLTAEQIGLALDEPPEAVQAALDDLKQKRQAAAEKMGDF